MTQITAASFLARTKSLPVRSKVNRDFAAAVKKALLPLVEGKPAKEKDLFKIRNSVVKSLKKDYPGASSAQNHSKAAIAPTVLMFSASDEGSQTEWITFEFENLYVYDGKPGTFSGIPS